MAKKIAKKISKRVPKKVKARRGKPLTPQRIMEMSWGFAPPLMIEAGLHNRVFDVLDTGAKTIAQVSAETGASTRGIGLLLDGLTGIGLVLRKGEKFSLAPDASAFLVSSKPGFFGGMARHVSRQLLPGWMQLSETVKTGKPGNRVNQQQGGAEFFAQFVEDIFNMSYGPACIAADALLKKVKGPASVLDIAAGSGVWGIAMAKKSPHVRVTAVDWSEVIPVTRRIADRHGVGSQFVFVDGDILEADLGNNHKVATLGHILHSEGEARSRQLLKRVHGALGSGGTIVIGEFVPDEGRSAPAMPLIFAVNMLVNTEEGSTYTLKEISSWLKEAGFSRVRTLASPGPSPLILADKA